MKRTENRFPSSTFAAAESLLSAGVILTLSIAMAYYVGGLLSA